MGHREWLALCDSTLNVGVSEEDAKLILDCVGEGRLACQGGSCGAEQWPTTRLLR